jgi:hypothetical protein
MGKIDRTTNRTTLAMISALMADVTRPGPKE